MPRPRRSEDMIVEIARLRYEQRLPQTEIARLLEISEATVSRALKSALDLGYIEFQVTPKAFRDSASEQRLKAHLDEIGRLLKKGGEVGKRLDFLIQE